MCNTAFPQRFEAFKPKSRFEVFEQVICNSFIPNPHHHTTHATCVQYKGNACVMSECSDSHTKPGVKMKGGRAAPHKPRQPVPGTRSEIFQFNRFSQTGSLIDLINPAGDASRTSKEKASILPPIVSVPGTIFGTTLSGTTLEGTNP